MIKKLLFLVLLLHLCGCTTTHFNLEKDYNLNKYPDKSIIFGELKFSGFSGYMDGGTSMKFTRIEDNKVFEMHATRSSFMEQIKAMGNEGLSRFYFELPKGLYQITYINRGNWEIIPKGIIFHVPDSGNVYYIGQLEIFALEKPGILSFSLKYGQRVVNNYEENAKIFIEQFPNINQTIEVKLMKVQEKEKGESAQYSTDIPYIPAR